MLTEHQVKEIREHLENAKNPIFYYDNDADGFCSFVLLRRFIERGKGVAVKSFPDLNASYARKTRELNADYVFVLDKPVISREFVEEIGKLNLPIVWIDHHDIPSGEFPDGFKNFFQYNSAKSGDMKGEPVTYLCYRVCEKKEDIWIAVVGCIADHFMPDFAEEFAKMLPEFWGKNIIEPFDAYFGTEVGKIARALNFGLKDSVSNVVRLQNFLITVKSPEEIFSESSGNYYFRKKYSEVKKKYDVLLERAKSNVEKKMIFFDYSGELSISSDLANELSYNYRGKYIAVCYRNGGVTNVSLRGKGVKKILENILKEIEGTGGGHEDAVGARIATGDLEKFRDLLSKSLPHSIS